MIKDSAIQYGRLPFGLVKYKGRVANGILPREIAPGRDTDTIAVVLYKRSDEDGMFSIVKELDGGYHWNLHESDIEGLRKISQYANEEEV